MLSDSEKRLYLINMLEKSKERKEMRPAALDIQKRKFLAALSKTKLNLTEKEDKLAEEAFKQDSIFPPIKHSPSHWTDTTGKEEIKKIILKHENFDITLYLNCAKVIFLAYSGKMPRPRDIYEAYTYVLTHARSFGDPAKNIFQFEGESDTPLSMQFDDDDISRPLSDSIYMRKITNLIEDLRLSYDESKYRILNVNVTYLTLLILRRSVRGETQFKDSLNHAKTHGDYVKLCLHPLHDQLPKVSDVFNGSVNQHAMKPSATLAIHAFFNGTDVLTKKVLQVTCVQYMEWNGLQLPALFFKVVQLYKIEEGQLWDSLRRMQYPPTDDELYRLSKAYYEQFKRSLAEPPETATWFPYCRSLDDSFHNDLCGADNWVACLILAYLVDLKLGFDKSFARNSHWTKKIGSPVMKDNVVKMAKQLSKEYPFAYKQTLPHSMPNSLM